jgi:hypothetical protein
MKALSQPFTRLSILAAAALALSGPVQAGPAPKGVSPYYGRWTVDENRPVFTARGRLYKTFDVAPCGRDFCGVSVDDGGKCGAVLFRFLGKHADATEELHGHGKWGDAQKDIVIYDATDPEAQQNRRLELYLGDGHDFGERSGNMPKFHSTYKRMGGARCTAR